MSDAETAQRIEKMRSVMPPEYPPGTPPNVPHTLEAATIAHITELAKSVSEDNKLKFWALLDKRILLANLTPTEHHAVIDQGGLAIELGGYDILKVWLENELLELSLYTDVSCSHDGFLLKRLTGKHTVQEGTFKEENAPKKGVLKQF